MEIPPEQELEIYGCEFMPSFINERLEEKPVDRSFFDVAYVEYFFAKGEQHSVQAYAGEYDRGQGSKSDEEMLAEYEKRSPFFRSY